jgi:hypothetical protein
MRFILQCTVEQKRKKRYVGLLSFKVIWRGDVSQTKAHLQITFFFAMAEIEVKQDERFDIGKYPIVDLSSYLTDQKMASADCRMVVDLLYQFGFLYVKDPRVNETHNDRFIDMMEKYYSQPDEIKAKDIRKEVSYQVGLTPARTERARDRCNLIAKLDEIEKPLTICPPG